MSKIRITINAEGDNAMRPIKTNDYPRQSGVETTFTITVRDEHAWYDSQADITEEDSPREYSVVQFFRDSKIFDWDVVKIDIKKQYYADFEEDNLF
ncbi:MAG TPA: hypothetical protein DCM40_37345 [Maribacter sp.]|nr:hypothetical protein [Maribacter sp.]